MNSQGRRLRAHMTSLAVVALLAACGGGGGGGGGSTPTPTTPTTPTATPIPESLTLTAPSGAESSVDLQFGNSASSLSGLTFSWDFGDGKNSTEPSPKHAYAKGGDYEVVLKISNTAGASREQRIKVSITNLANVKGLVCSGANDGGWCWQQPLPTGNGRNSTYFADAKTIFTVGDNGEIFKSTDAGATWTAQRSGVTSSLRTISFSSAQDGWIVGDYGALLRTSDGGTTWSLNKIPDTYSYYPALSVIDANKAILADARYTIDGGKTWTTPPYSPTKVSPKGVFWRMDYSGNLGKSTDFGLSTPTVLQVKEDGYYLNNNDLSLVDEKTLFVSATFYRYEPVTYKTVYKSVLWRSADGGASWTRIEPAGLPGSGYGAFVHVLRASADDSTLVGYSNGSVVRSTDNGATWTTVTVSDSSYYYSLNYVETLAVGKTLLIPGYRAVFRSADAGLTWTRATVTGADNSYDYFSGLRQIEGNNYSMRDGQGQTYLSTDAGSTWKLASSRADASYSGTPAAAFLDSKRGLMLSAKGELSETKDGGKTWAVKLPGIATGSEFQLQFVNATTGWMLVGDGRLYKTTDGAATWGSPQLLRNYGLSAIGFSDENRGWGRLRYGSPNFVMTTDGGKSWADITAPNYTMGLNVINDKQLIAYGNNGMLATSADGGKTWSQRFTGTSNPVTQVTASDSKTLWATAGTQLLRSDDQGATWNAANVGLQQDGLYDIAFADARNGWAVGARGLVIATTDGGKTWIRQPTGTARDLRRVIPVDAKTAWIAGDYGTLLATGNGGF